MAYLDRVNKRGGVHGRPVKLLVEDHQYESEPAVQNTNRLITQYRRKMVTVLSEGPECAR